MTSANKLAPILATGALALTLGLGLTACGGQQSQTSEPTKEAPTEQTTEKSTETDKTSTSPSDAKAASDSAEAVTGTTTEGVPAEANGGDQAAFIGNAKATNIALEDAGLKETDVTELECELDPDDAVLHYDVSFKANGTEYDYDIDAATGEITARNSEVDD